MSKRGFYDRLKAHQIAWARAHGIDEDHREGHANRPWVLKTEHKKRNLYAPNWWQYIAGKEHRWVRALTSSQCFAVNLFAPLLENPDTARAVFGELVPQKALEPMDVVVVGLEHTPDDGPTWLGESGQPTQVDVCLTVTRLGAPVGHLLIEVKLGEPGFGSCRGAKGLDKQGRGNPRPSRCLDLRAVLEDPGRQCWLAEEEGRRYWDFMKASGSPFQFDRIPPDAACPFRGRLYQLMRNKVLAQAMVGETGADWADIAVCIHPENDRVRTLREPVAQETDALKAFHMLLGKSQVYEVDPRNVVESAAAADLSLKNWAGWMRERYLLN